MKLYLSIFTLLLLASQVLGNTSPNLKLHIDNSPLHTIENPLQVDIKSFAAIPALSIDQRFLFEGMQVTSYKIDLLQSNNLAQTSIKQEIVVKAEMKIKRYPRLLNPTLNQENTEGQGVYIAPRMVIGSGNEFVQDVEKVRHHFVQPSVNLGYDFRCSTFKLELFASAGFGYATDFSKSSNLYDFQTGIIVNL